MSGGLAAAVVLISSTAAYAASRTQPADETYVACVNNTTGAMRLIDPLAGQTCAGDPGPGQERQISWSKSGARGPEGPAGQRGPRGESGDDGEDGDGGGRLGRLEDLEGIRCGSGAEAGRVEINVGAPENGSVIQLVCMTEDTVTVPRTPLPPIPVPTTRPPTTTAPKPTQYPDRPSEDPDENRPPAPGPGGGNDDGGGNWPADGGSPGGGNPGGGSNADGGANSGAQKPGEPSSIPDLDEGPDGEASPPV
jgi:hypothetical protein